MNTLQGSISNQRNARATLISGTRVQQVALYYKYVLQEARSYHFPIPTLVVGSWCRLFTAGRYQSKQNEDGLHIVRFCPLNGNSCSSQKCAHKEADSTFVHYHASNHYFHSLSIGTDCQQGQFKRDRNLSFKFFFHSF